MANQGEFTPNIQTYADDIIEKYTAGEQEKTDIDRQISSLKRERRAAMDVAAVPFDQQIATLQDKQRGVTHERADVSNHFKRETLQELALKICLANEYGDRLNKGTDYFEAEMIQASEHPPTSYPKPRNEKVIERVATFEAFLHELRTSSDDLPLLVADLHWQDLGESMRIYTGTPQPENWKKFGG